MSILKQLLLVALCVASSSFASAQNSAPILIEEFTATWCGWCPNGSYMLDTLLVDKPEVLVLTIHAEDPLSFPEGQEVADAFMNGTPSAAFNRQKLDGFFNVSVPWHEWAEVVEYDFGGIVPFEVISQTTFNETDRTLTIEVLTESKGVLNGDFRVNVMVVQKTFSDPGNITYYQSNFFDGQEDHPLGDAGWPITDYVYKNLVRAMLGGAWGLGNIIPETTVAGAEYTTTFTYTVPESYDVNNLLLVPVVSDYNEDVKDRSIITFSKEELDFTTGPTPEDTTVINTTDTTVTNMTDTTSVTVISGIESTELPINQLAFYPNPVKNTLFLQTPTPIKQYIIWDAAGKKIIDRSATNGQTIQVHTLKQGLYFIEVIDQTNITWRNRFIKN